MYYRDAKALAEKVEYWKTFDESLLAKTHFLVVDDGSPPDEAAAPVSPARKSKARKVSPKARPPQVVEAGAAGSAARVTVVAIDQDLVWNIAGARNLIFAVAPTDVVLTHYKSMDRGRVLLGLRRRRQQRRLSEEGYLVLVSYRPLARLSAALTRKYNNLISSSPACADRAPRPRAASPAGARGTASGSPPRTRGARPAAAPGGRRSRASSPGPAPPRGRGP